MAASDQSDHRQVLDRILRAEGVVDDDIRELATFPFDVEEPLVFLTLGVALDVLKRHKAGLITNASLEAWANALEVCDAVELEQAHKDVLQQCLFELSTPVLTGQSVSDLAAAWRRRLASIAASSRTRS